MPTKIIYLILLILACSAHGAIETISGFQFKSCRDETCFQMKADRALKGYLSDLFILEGPIQFVRVSPEKGKETWRGDDGIYDPVRMSFLLHGRDKDLLIELSKLEVIEFSKGQ